MTMLPSWYDQLNLASGGTIDTGSGDLAPLGYADNDIRESAARFSISVAIGRERLARSAINEVHQQLPFLLPQDDLELRAAHPQSTAHANAGPINQRCR